LKKRDIKAAAIFSGMSHAEILTTLENCVFDAYKFLYVAPERLSTPLFLEKIKDVKICLIAVDESHCISQWGYDFRPSYLKIADIREIIPHVPLLALTATATPDVVTDIQEKLKFKEKNVFQKSFSRSNLAYVVRITENKEEQLLNILNKVPGTSVVYVRNRKKTKEIAEFLVQNGISAEHFHAGLDNKVKDERQKRWKNGQTRVIVSTNAFGMGIDKAEVRSVVHIDLPDSLEAYFQEAGRAGRDEKKAFAVLLYNNSDAVKLKKRISDTFPPKEVVVKTYEALGNYLQVAVGSGLNRVFPFNISDFCQKFHLPILISYNALKILQQAEYIELTDEQDSNSQVMFLTGRDDLYKINQTPEHEKLVHILLRSYTGLFTEYASINEDLIASRLGITHQEVYDRLTALSQQQIIKYIPRKKTPFVCFTRLREATDLVVIGKEAYDLRYNRYITRINSVLGYANEENLCRSQILLAYFGERDVAPCGQCDICLKNKEKEVSDDEFEKIAAFIFQTLSIKEISTNVLLSQSPYKQKKMLKVIRFLLDNSRIAQNERLLLCIKK
jgi:ATP-dependent DNA helicase RecQ